MLIVMSSQHEDALLHPFIWRFYGIQSSIAICKTVST
jgi:hypothetical protein